MRNARKRSTSTSEDEAAMVSGGQLTVIRSSSVESREEDVDSCMLSIFYKSG